ncbi:MAG: acylneuraminate cytidylyltransferase family protein [Methanosarcinaceae archaeon]|nr:acylneuraminate cytidylyltransferase family protein [Methanosarcinaceae archaeon]
MKPKIIAIIPARGGSKGIPRKNIQMLAGLPLIAHTIKEALQSQYVDTVVVSTEDQEIANISKRYGSEIVERPEKIAKDDSPTIDAILHVLRNYEAKNKKYDVVVLLQPTSPLKSSFDIDTAIELFIRNDCDSLISVCETTHTPYWCYNIKESYLNPIFDKESQKRRQDLPETYRPNGAIFIAYTEIIKNKKDFVTKKTIPYIMSIERSIDIDTEFDLLFANYLMGKT